MNRTTKLYGRHADNTRTAIITAIVILLALTCLLPLWNVVAISLSSSEAVAGNQVGLFPIGFSLASYKMLLEDGQFWRSFSISVLRVVIGWAVNILLTVLLAYPLSKTKAEFRGRNIMMGLTVFAMLFSGGMIPLYLIVKNLGLLNNIGSLVLPGAVPVFSVILLMNFFLALPPSLEEAACIDGANPWQILTKIYIPVSIPSIATISLFSVVGHWNDFQSGLLYITKVVNYPLQTYIQSLNINIAALVESGDVNALKNALEISNRNLNAAKIVVSVIPLLCIYPILQKYFITGIVVGSVKE